MTPLFTAADARLVDRCGNRGECVRWRIAERTDGSSAESLELLPIPAATEDGVIELLFALEETYRNNYNNLSYA